MNIQWLGHAAFLITTGEGLKILMDPYQAGGYGGAIGYGKIELAPDIVTISHDQHEDHNAAGSLKGNPVIVKTPGKEKIRGVVINRVQTFHDNSGGSERGPNLVIGLEADGLRVVHCGDLGHVLTPEHVAAIGPVDVLLVPIGGTFTLDAGEADAVVAQLKPKIVVPMHYKTAKCGFPLLHVEDFLKGKKRVKKLSGSTLEVKAGALPAETEIVVLEHAL